MGACNSLFSPKHQDDDAEGRMRVLQEENRKLHEIVSSLQMELHQQRSEVMRMTYMLKEERQEVADGGPFVRKLSLIHI